MIFDDYLRRSIRSAFSIGSNLRQSNYPPTDASSIKAQIASKPPSFQIPLAFKLIIQAQKQGLRTILPFKLLKDLERPRVNIHHQTAGRQPDEAEKTSVRQSLMLSLRTTPEPLNNKSAGNSSSGLVNSIFRL